MLSESRKFLLSKLVRFDGSKLPNADFTKAVRQCQRKEEENKLYMNKMGVPNFGGLVKLKYNMH